jgi:hypothetical protein
VLSNLVDDLRGGGGAPEAIAHYADTGIELTRALLDLHPAEPDYARALARRLMQRATLVPATPGAIDDLREAVAAIELLVADDPLPWRVDEAHEIHERADALLDAWNAQPIEQADPAAFSEPLAWLDPERAGTDGAPLHVYHRLLRFSTRLPPTVPSNGPRLRVADDELVGVWGDDAAAGGFVVGLADAASPDPTADLTAGTPTGPLPGLQTWQVTTWREERPPGALVEHLAAATVRAFSLQLRSPDAPTALRGYLLVIERQGLRWRIRLTVPQTADEWRTISAADEIAAVVFTALQLS